jgi:hypothetical protein
MSFESAQTSCSQSVLPVETRTALFAAKQVSSRIEVVGREESAPVERSHSSQHQRLVVRLETDGASSESGQLSLGR